MSEGAEVAMERNEEREAEAGFSAHEYRLQSASLISQKTPLEICSTTENPKNTKELAVFPPFL
jgi:hypothetical protein